MKRAWTLTALVVVVVACGGTDEPEGPPVSSVASPPGTTTTTTSSPPTTPSTTAAPLPSTTAPLAGSGPGGEFETWDAGNRGFVVSVPAGWLILDEVAETTKLQVLEVIGRPATRELLATPMVLAADPASNGNGLFIAPIPPAAVSGPYDEYAELAALDEPALRDVEALVAGTGAEPVTARLTTTAQGHIALVVATRLFGLNFEMITVTPETGVAWTIVGSYGDELYAAGAADVVLGSFLVTGEPEIREPGPSDDELVAEVAGTPEIHGALLPPYPTDADDDSALGAIAPTVIGADFDGTRVTIEPDGVPKAIAFMAHWCPHCRDEVSVVQSWLETTGGIAGVEIVTVVTAYSPDRGNWPPLDWLEGEGWTPPVIRDDAASSIYRAYGTGRFPYWVFLNGDGAVALRLEGTVDIPTLESILLGLTS